MWGAGRGGVRCRQGAAADWVALNLKGPNRAFRISFLIYYDDDDSGGGGSDGGGSGSCSKD